MKISHILEGIKNTIFVQEEVEKIANQRNEICNTCSKNSANSEKEFFDAGKYHSTVRPDVHCTVCACNLHAKVRSLHTNCPIDKWASVATKEEAAKIAAVIDGN